MDTDANRDDEDRRVRGPEHGDRNTGGPEHGDHDRDRSRDNHLDSFDSSRPVRASGEREHDDPLSRSAERDRCSLKDRATSERGSQEGALFSEDRLSPLEDVSELPHVIEKPGKENSEVPDVTLKAERVGPWQDKDLLPTFQDMDDWVQKHHDEIKWAFRRDGVFWDEQLNHAEDILVEKEQRRMLWERTWQQREKQQFRKERHRMERVREIIRNDRLSGWLK